MTTPTPFLPLPVSNKRQSGQAMVFTLLFGAACAVIALLMFNSGMLANAKTRLQNASDAGAYSAGVLQARDHNFSAYTNRAMVANQVAVVQLASLKSYLEDARHTHERMGEATLTFEADWIPVSTPMWDYAENLPIETVASTYENTVGFVVQRLDNLINAFKIAQQAHHLATAADMVLVAEEVIKRNDPQAQLTTGAFQLGVTGYQVVTWAGYTRQHSANDSSAEADRFANVVVSKQSTDSFTRSRTSVPVPSWASEVQLCSALPNYISSFTIFGFTHAGGSMLSEDKKRWLALDATWGTGMQSCTVWVPCWTGLCPATEATPLIDGNFARGDSGGAVVGVDGAYATTSGYAGNPSDSDNFGGALVNPMTFIPAQIRHKSTGPGASLDTAGGLQDYYRDVSDTSAVPVNQSAEENGGKFAVTIEVERTGASVRTSSKLLPDADKLKLTDGMKSDSMRVLSSSHAYFYRAKNNTGFTASGWQRADNKTELANLFNPYWQTRLVDRSVPDRTASWGTH